MREQQDPNVGPKLLEAHCFFVTFVVQVEAAHGHRASSGQLPGGGGPCRPPRHRQESHLLFSAGTDLLPTPRPSHLPLSTDRDKCSDLDPSRNQLGSSTAPKPLWSSQLSFLPRVYASQRLTALLCLWSRTFLCLLHLPMDQDYLLFPSP